MRIAREIMTEHPATLRADASILEAARMLHTLSVRHLPVVAGDGVVVGMVTDREVQSVTVPALMGPEHAAELRKAMTAPVASIMGRDVIKVGEDATLRQVAGAMLENGAGAVAVVGHTGALLGIVSYMDVLRQLPLYED